MSARSLLPVLAAIAAAAPPSEAPSAGVPRFRQRRYYDPASSPFPQNHTKASRPLHKKRPHTKAEYAAVGRAVEKRDRKAQRRLEEQRRRDAARGRP